MGAGRYRLSRREPAVAPRPRSAVARRLAETARGCAAPGARVCRRGEARPRRADAAAGRGLRAAADRARAVPRDGAPDSDGGARTAREPGRGPPRLRAAAHDAPRRAWHRAQPRRAARPPSPPRRGAGDDGLDLLGLGKDVLARHLALELRMICGEVLLRVCPELVVVHALDDLAADAVDALASGRRLHRRIVGATHRAGGRVSRVERVQALRRLVGELDRSYRLIIG